MCCGGAWGSAHSYLSYANGVYLKLLRNATACYVMVTHGFSGVENFNVRILTQRVQITLLACNEVKQMSDPDRLYPSSQLTRLWESLKCHDNRVNTCGDWCPRKQTFSFLRFRCVIQ